MGQVRDSILQELPAKTQWNPIPLDFLLEKYSLKNGYVQFLIGIWVIFIGLCIASVLVLSPIKALMGGTEQQSLYSFFVLYPPLFLGTLTVFWFGFEWGFIPVFLSAFLVAFSSQMPVYWALLFGIAFVLGLGIFALCYHSIAISPCLNSLKSVAFFTSVAFVAALASSLGSFVWSLYHDLSPFETITIWKGWWTGTFIQSMVLVAPFLYFFTPTIERVKRRFFSIPKSEVTLQWIYTAIISVVGVLILFIVGASILGSVGINEELAMLPARFAENIQKVTGSFQIVTAISIGLIMAAGMGGIYLVGSWNRNLEEKVEEQTKKLKKSEVSLQEALEERDSLLHQVNYRVRDNLTIVLALLELQLKTGKEKSIEKTLKNSHARLRSLAIIYETMHQTQAIDDVNLKQYCLKLSNRVSQSYKKENQTIEVHIESDEVEMEIGHAVPLAMILNELLVNSYVHAFKNRESGSIFVKIKKEKYQIRLTVRDNGTGLPDDFDPSKQETLGMKLILTLTRQLNGKFFIDQSEKTGFNLTMPIEYDNA